MNFDKKSIEDKIFVTNDQVEFSSSLSTPQYVKVKRANYIKNNSFHTIFQIIDISDSIRLYYEQKDQSEFLELVNACVSHELRNPLNSIIAQNILKLKLYKKLSNILNQIKNSGNVEKQAKEMERIIDSLNEGLKVQESSSSLMKFLV